MDFSRNRRDSGRLLPFVRRSLWVTLLLAMANGAFSASSAAIPAEFAGKTFEYSALKREVDTNRQLYQELLTKTKQTGLETELKTTNIRVVEKAEIPRGPVSPPL